MYVDFVLYSVCPRPDTHGTRRVPVSGFTALPAIDHAKHIGSGMPCAMSVRDSMRGERGFHAPDRSPGRICARWILPTNCTALHVCEPKFPPSLDEQLIALGFWDPGGGGYTRTSGPANSWRERVAQPAHAHIHARGGIADAPQ